MSEAPSIDLSELYQEVAAKLREAELRAAELRGQMQLIEHLLRESRQLRSGDNLGEQRP